MKKEYNKYTIFTDRFPIIIVVLIAVVALIFIFKFKEKFPMQVFSGGSTTTQSQAMETYPIIVASPSQEEVFDFPSKNAYIPMEVKLKEIEGINYKVNLVLNDKDTIKTFDSPPYKFNWYPSKSGEYTTAANIVDTGNKILSSSNKVRFVVNLRDEEEITATTEEAPEVIANVTEETIAAGIIPTVNLRIFEGPVYSEGRDICYYRVKATITGDPAPVVYFSKDDSGGAWGKNTAQINLQNGESYDLVVSAVNSVGTAVNHIILAWGQ